jgi:hypothetical protein
MSFSLKDNEQQAREALRAFWAGTSLGRPALHVIVQNPDYVKTDWPGPGEEEENKEHDFLPAWHAWRMDEYLKSTLFLAEAMPGTILRMGSLLVTVAVLAGGDYEFHSNSGWIQVLPDIWERPLPRFDPQSSAAQGIEACLRGLAQTVGRRGFVSPPIMLDGLTTLSSFRTPRQLCLDVIERPHDVRRWSDALTTLYLEAYEHYYRLCQRLGYGDTCTWLASMAEDRMEAVQCDFGVMLSPRMFEQFALPDLRRVTEYMSYSLYHLDGTPQMRFLDLLRSLPRLNGIQWNPEPPAGSPVGWIEAFRDIRRRRFSLYISCGTVGEAIEITRALGPDGLMLVMPRFDSLREAEQAIRDIRAAC